MIYSFGHSSKLRRNSNYLEFFEKNGSASSFVSNLKTLPNPILNKIVYGFSASNYYQAPTNVFGGGVTGTKRLVFRVESLPSGGQKVIVGKVNSSTGWYIRTLGTVLDVVMSGGTILSSGFTILAGHVGQSFVVHFTNNGSALKMYVNGLQVGSSVTSTGAPNPVSSSLFTVGTAQPALSLFNNHLGVFNYNETASVLTDSNIYDDAMAIINQTGGKTYTAMTSSIHNLVADDLTTGSNWVDKISGTLNVFGTPTIVTI